MREIVLAVRSDGSFVVQRRSLEGVYEVLASGHVAKDPGQGDPLCVTHVKDVKDGVNDAWRRRLILVAAMSLMNLERGKEGEP